MASYNWSTKTQAYLAKIAGKEVNNLPEPTTKEQQLLKEIAENGGSGGGFRVITIEEDEAGNPVADITYEEVDALVASGTPIFVWDYYSRGDNATPVPVTHIGFNGTTSPETLELEFFYSTGNQELLCRTLSFNPTGDVILE